MKHVVIITGGTLNPSFAKEYIKEPCFFIAVDKGLEYADAIGIVPNLILGDFDSVSKELPEIYQKRGSLIKTFSSMKDNTDTDLAIREALENEADQITILGATGSRLDHVLSNIGLLKKVLDYANANQKHIPCHIVDEHNRILMTQKKFCFSKENMFGEYISLIAYTEEVTGITLKGMKYPLQNYTLSHEESIGISNQIEEEEAFIDMKTGILLIVESRD